MSDLYLTRARLRSDVPTAALRALLLPKDDSARAGVGHKLLWTLFADRADRVRDFLWRETKPGTYYILSCRPPADHHGMFELDAAKPFSPVLAAGDRLEFMLRANATVARGRGPGVRGKTCDVVMDALHEIEREARAERRRQVMQEAGVAWLARQGERAGFVLPQTTGPTQKEETATIEGCTVRVTAYRTLRVPHRGPRAKIGVLDFEGVLEVTDPDTFVAALGRGIGRAKAFGCGLMLIRRAASRHA
ncbi:MAG TPA: type I-E CRISPR-associated protein Cas6/Cse3/CasE [Gemmatimonadaceae bacterium]